MPVTSSEGWRTWLAVGVMVSCVAGCNSILGRQGMPADPLFAGAKPAESKALQAHPVLLAFSEPEAPADPELALASQSPARPKMLPADLSRGSVPGLLTGRPGMPEGNKKNAPTPLP